MALLKDTEGYNLPTDENGESFFDVDLCDWNRGRGPMLTIGIPRYFETDDEQIYSSEGVLHVPLQDVLEEYLRDFEEIDGGDGIPNFTKWLRLYANRFESINLSRKGCR